ncbi:MAG: sigma-70 family RNA polymerase sigma factor [Oscillospiraceae bacterium]|nr:sigma-70 family RNA polymerase sigma factor [Oscillospiraceae bacterium]MBR6656807.1 sigma-70 family RNA polymerase sigma factor [Oscillospiraceae bacterium]
MEKEKILGELSEKYGKTCKTIAKNILRNEEDAEEILNDALLAFWNSAFSDFPENPGAWLCKTVRNMALNRLAFLSAEKRGSGNAEIALSELEECVPSKNSVEEEINESAFIEAIENFLLSQPEEKRNIFLRRYWYMFSVSEIARDLKISESKVKSVLFRMRKELRKKLEKEEFI